jgi:hypothetical protein
MQLEAAKHLFFLPPHESGRPPWIKRLMPFVFNRMMRKSAGRLQR